MDAWHFKKNTSFNFKKRKCFPWLNKDVLVYRIEGNRSSSFGAIFLSNRVNSLPNAEDELRHEYGHNIQLSLVGPVKYGVYIGIPSWQKWGPWSKADRYYEAPWETSADIFGGVQSNNQSSEVVARGIFYFWMLMW